jgi:hypothetical protein
VTSVSNFISKHIQQGQQKAAKKLTAQLRRKAYQSGWPSSASRHLTVVPSDLSYKVTYPSKHPVVRQFMAGVKDTEATAYFDRVLRKTRII